jgi:hypothetical protein
LRQSHIVRTVRIPFILLSILAAGCTSSTTSPSTAVTPSTFVMTWGSLTFPTTGVGRTSAALAVTLWNTGANPVPVASVTDDNTGEFPWTTTCQVGGMLAANSTCVVSVTFTPTALGAQTATLTIGANSTTQSLSLTGTGATVNPQLTISSAGDTAPTVFLLSVTGATPGGALTLHTIYTPAPGDPGATFPDTTWTADASGNLTANVTTESPGTYEHWFVDVTSGLSSNHVVHVGPQ